EVEPSIPSARPAGRIDRTGTARGDEMSQLFDYFVCSRLMIVEWAAALAEGDEQLRAEIEAVMPRLARLEDIGQDEFNLLAACAAGESVDAVMPGSNPRARPDGPSQPAGPSRLSQPGRSMTMTRAHNPGRACEVTATTSKEPRIH